MSIKWRVDSIEVKHDGYTDVPELNMSLVGWPEFARDTSVSSMNMLSKDIECKLNSDCMTTRPMTPLKMGFDIKKTDITKEMAMLQMHAYSMVGKNPFAIKNVIFNEPATIVFWADGTKTVVKCQEGDVFDPEKGLAMAFMKKVMGNKGHYFETIKKWVPEEYYEEPVEKKRVIIGRVARVETSSDGVNAYVDLNRSVDAKKLVDMLTNTDVTASMDMVCDSWATAVKVIKEDK